MLILVLAYKNGFKISQYIMAFNGMMILVLAYKNGFKSKSVYYGL